jgi:hypothetical protein
MSKLKNTETIKKFLDGTHRSQTRTVTGWKAADKKKRAVGEIWTDENGYEWEQMDGYRIKHGKLDELRDFLYVPKTCPKCSNPMTKRLDKKYWNIHKMCSDCAILMETHLKCQGQYSDYEKEKMKQNAISWLKDAELDKEMIKEILTKNAYVNEDGSFEKWSLPEPPEVMKQKIDEQFEQFKNEFKKAWGLNDVTNEA